MLTLQACLAGVDFAHLLRSAERPQFEIMTPEEQAEYDLDFQYFLGFVGIAVPALAGLGFYASRRGIWRYATHEHLTSDVVKEMARKKRSLHGVVVRVGDAGRITTLGGLSPEN